MKNYNNYIAALKLKDEEAFEIIYHETKTSVYSLILSIINDKSLAEDVMQDTYIKMIKYINSYQEGTNFRNWLLTIARNTSLDYYRKRNKEILVDIEEKEYLFTSETPSINIDSEKLLSLLSQEEKEIVLLRLVNNIKHRDIAEIVNKPIGTVLWLYQRAIKKMRKYKGGN